MKRAAGAVLLWLAAGACGGAAQGAAAGRAAPGQGGAHAAAAPGAEVGGPGAEAGGPGDASAVDTPPPTPTAGPRPPPRPVTPACRAAYADYERAWTNWFDANLDDTDSAAEIIAEFGQELPMRSALAQMRETADALRYEPGFDLWFVALTATERAIDLCGEGAPRPTQGAPRPTQGAAAAGSTEST